MGKKCSSKIFLAGRDLIVNSASHLRRNISNFFFLKLYASEITIDRGT